MRILTFSTLYPSSVRPTHGIFVETRLRKVVESGEVSAKVVAPVPWFPSTHPRFGENARMARTPRQEIHNGLDVRHPRFLLPPKIGTTIAPFSLALGALQAIRNVLDEGFNFDLIDAHYYYPDGVAAALLANYFRKPFVVTARGTDINLIPRYAIPRRLIQWTAARARMSISVCRALSEELEQLGADPARLLVLRNGVDSEKFQPVEQSGARVRLGIAARPTLLSVGHLIERKGHHLIIEALKRLPRFQLLIAGEGPDRTVLESLAARCGVADRVRFVGSVPQAELKSYYSAADILVLASSREGWANVLLESMACGTPVVATRIWGTPEVVSSPVAGRLARERTSEALAESVGDLFESLPNRADVRLFSQKFDWAETTQGQIDLFRSIVGQAGDVRPAERTDVARI
jgi:glycosyltransferase involved in cell wall biosynthesis